MNDVYEVEKILDAKLVKKEWKFLIKWLHYPESSNSWEPEKNLDPDLLKNFWLEHDRDEFLSPEKNCFLPANSLTFYDKDDMKSTFDSHFPLIKKGSDIKKISGYKRGADGTFYYKALTEKYKIPIFIPSKWIRENSPEKLVEFFESNVKI